MIVSSGYYVAASQSNGTLNLSSETMHDTMVKELTVGLDGVDAGIKCGIIGEIGVSWPMHSESHFIEHLISFKLNKYFIRPTLDKNNIFISL